MDDWENVPEIDQKSWEAGRDAAINYIMEQVRLLKIDMGLTPLQRTTTYSDTQILDLETLALELNHLKYQRT